MFTNKITNTRRKYLLRLLMGTIFLSLGIFTTPGNTQDLVLENMTVSTTERYTASNSITAGPNFTVTNTGEATLESGNFITFKPRFLVIGGGQLYALTGVSTGLMEKEEASLPTQFHLQQNYPNPFNPITNIEFSLPEAVEVNLKVLNILGEEVATLVSEQLGAGQYTYEWDASSFPSGLYLYRLSAGSFVETKKMVLIK
jgi:hypothetical protein